MLQFVIVKYHVLLPKCDGKLKEKKKEGSNAMPNYYLPTEELPRLLIDHL